MASVPPVSLEPGYRLDRYELLCKIGQGGMATVWLARTQGKHGFERLFAVKTVLPEHAMDREFRTMLLDEARIVAAIDHPNVARILDVGEDRDIPFLVLEYVAGDALNHLHRKLVAIDKRIPPAIILRVLADTCAGLHAAHELVGPDGKPLGIVHRDVSPQNILVSEQGIAKLIDFGVAKAAGRLTAETATGIIKGKVAYMAPEQALGLPVDRRADVWAVGAIAYFLLAGAPPFNGPNDAARVIRAVSGDPPDPLPDTVPGPIKEVVLKALSREAGARYATCAELRRALEDAAVKSGSTATTDDVAKFCAEYAADAVRSRKKMLDRALAAASDRASARDILTTVPTGTGSGPSFVGPPTPIDPLRQSIHQDETSVGTIARGVSVIEASPRPPRRWVPAAVGAGVLVLVGGGIAVGALVTRTSDGRGSAVPPQATDSALPGATGAPATSASVAPLAAALPTSSTAPVPPTSASAAGSAKPSSPSTARTTTAAPQPSKPPRGPGRAGDKPPDDTIF